MHRKLLTERLPFRSPGMSTAVTMFPPTRRLPPTPRPGRGEVLPPLVQRSVRGLSVLEGPARPPRCRRTRWPANHYTQGQRQPHSHCARGRHPCPCQLPLLFPMYCKATRQDFRTPPDIHNTFFQCRERQRDLSEGTDSSRGKAPTGLDAALGRRAAPAPGPPAPPGRRGRGGVHSRPWPHAPLCNTKGKARH